MLGFDGDKMLTFVTIAGLVALGVVIALLVRLEERLAHVHAIGQVWLTGYSSIHPVFPPFQLYAQLARARAARALCEEAERDLRTPREAGTSPAEEARYRRWIEAEYDRETEGWSYSLMVEANLRVMLGSSSRAEALNWFRDQTPAIGAKGERIDRRRRQREAGGDAAPPDGHRASRPWESDPFSYQTAGGRDLIGGAERAAWADYPHGLPKK